MTEKESKIERRKRRKAVMAEIAKIEMVARTGGKLNEKRLRELGDQLENISLEKQEDFYPERMDGEKLTVKYFKMAEANGIGVNTFKYRFYKLGWSAEKAATKKVEKLTHIDDSGITKEIYLHEKKNFTTDEKIAKNFNISMRALERFKRLEGVSRKIRKQKGEFDL